MTELTKKYTWNEAVHLIPKTLECYFEDTKSCYKESKDFLLDIPVILVPLDELSSIVNKEVAITTGSETTVAISLLDNNAIIFSDFCKLYEGSSLPILDKINTIKGIGSITNETKNNIDKLPILESLEIDEIPTYQDLVSKYPINIVTIL